MSFSCEWEQQYSANRQNSIWPWSDLVSYVMRYCDHNRVFKVLELGCGVGANIPFFKSLGVDYYAIEGSKRAVERLKNAFPCYKNNIVCGDFTKQIDFQGKFDLVVDRASLTHNSSTDIENCLQLIVNVLEQDGKFVGIHWFSTQHSDYNSRDGINIDTYTKSNMNTGPFNGVGRVHFSDEQHLQDLFAEHFVLDKLEHHLIECRSSNVFLAWWNFIAVKKNIRGG